jgi:RsmE family RNA methyltransferase
MNLILLFEEDFVSLDDVSAGARTRCGQVRLRGRRLDYVRTVHRASRGDEFCVGLLGGRIGRGRVVALTPGELEMEIVLEHDPPPALQATLVLALPRPPVLKRVLISATSMGVKRIELLHCRRVEKSFWSSSAVKAESLHEQLLLGLEQARDTLLPSVSLHRRFRPFVEDQLPALAADRLGIVAHPEASTPFPKDVSGPVTLVVGPEAGFVPFELERLEAAGLLPVRIGERALRVETAIPALLGRML